MKAMTLAAWKWIVIAVLVAAVGGLLLFGLGRKRGTRTYRWRMAMWTLALSLMGGIGLISLGATMSGCELPGTSQCYAAVPPGDLLQEQTVQPDAQADLLPPPDMQVTCYAPRPPDWTEQDVRADQKEEDIPVMCYEPIMDVKPDGNTVEPDGTTIQPDLGPTCYLVALDMVDEGTATPDVQVTCYAPLPPDWTEQDVKTDSKEEDVQIMCYDPLPPDVK